MPGVANIIEDIMREIPDFPHDPAVSREDAYSNILVNQCRNLREQCDQIVQSISVRSRLESRLCVIEDELDVFAKDALNDVGAAMEACISLGKEKSEIRSEIANLTDLIAFRLGSVSYIFFPVENAQPKYDRDGWTRYEQLQQLERQHWRGPAAFQPSLALKEYRERLKTEAAQWAAVRARRGRDMTRIIFLSIGTYLRDLCSDRSARDAVVHRDERIDFNSSAASSQADPTRLEVDLQRLRSSLEEVADFAFEAEVAIHFVGASIRKRRVRSRNHHFGRGHPGDPHDA